MRAQAFCGNPYDKNRIRPIANLGSCRGKPDGGLWTSDVLSHGETVWQEWCKLYWESEYKRMLKGCVTILIPASTAKVYVIDSVEKAEYLQDEYNFNWHLIAQNYDAVEVRDNMVSTMYWDFSGCWELPSTVWFRDAFL